MKRYWWPLTFAALLAAWLLLIEPRWSEHARTHDPSWIHIVSELRGLTEHSPFVNDVIVDGPNIGDPVRASTHFTTARPPQEVIAYFSDRFDRAGWKRLASAKEGSFCRRGEDLSLDVHAGQDLTSVRIELYERSFPCVGALSPVELEQLRQHPIE